MQFDKIGLKVPNILLPKKGADVGKWAVVACDQYTSEPEYWDDAAKLTADSPSTLNLVYPEVYLEEAEDNKVKRIASINKTMQAYLDEGVLEEHKNCFILVDRKTSHAESRKGLVVAIDLEAYDYNKGSQTLIRATEGTILDRIPPRVRIRENAPIELPHIMVLIDDPDKTVIEPLFNENLEKVYDTELMLNGGHIVGYKVSEAKLIEQVATGIEKLADKGLFDSKYQVSDKGVLLYAMGDGNHSLATAKAIWENIKSNALDKDSVMNNPARFALVELVNVHDDGLVFEPIHRVVFDVNETHMLEAMKNYYAANGSELNTETFKTKDEANKKINELGNNQDVHAIGYVTENGYGVMAVYKPKLNLHVGTLQSFLDDYLKNNTNAKIDYIHGESVVTDLGTKSGNIGFYLPGMDKHDLFKTVIVDGALPRKTFSMGEAEEKRYYLECRKIK